jgi:hypothetical protein
MVWRAKLKYKFEVVLSDMKNYVQIMDNKTLKKSFNNLYAFNYLLSEISELKPNSPSIFILNKSMFDTENRKEGEYYTALPVNVLNAIRDRKIDRKEARILYYIKSYINYTDFKKNYCYTGIEKTMIKELKMGKNTIPSYTESLKKKKLIHIERNFLKTDFQYTEEGKLIRSKYNNHYYLNYDAIQNL